MIKQLAQTDLSIAIEIIRESFATVAENYNITKENCPNHTSFLTTEKLQNHFNSGWLMYGLYNNKRLVGYVSLSKGNGGTFELHNLAVLPEYRHKGYGKQLLDLCKAKVKELGGDKIIIGIIEKNTVLKNWYAVNGFIHIGIKTFTHLPFTVGFMEWDAKLAF